VSAELEGTRALVLHLDQRCGHLPLTYANLLSIVTGWKWFFPCHVFMDRGCTGFVEFPFVHCGYEYLFFMSKSL
jgi:hypothetical protein